MTECRYCFETDKEFITPCKCYGTLRYVHASCLTKWINTKKEPWTCEVCKYNYVYQQTVSLKPFIIHTFIYLVFLWGSILLLGYFLQPISTPIVDNYWLHLIYTGFVFSHLVIVTVLATSLFISILDGIRNSWLFYLFYFVVCYTIVFFLGEILLYLIYMKYIHRESVSIKFENYHEPI